MTIENEKKPREFWIQEAAYCPIVFFDKEDFVRHETETHELEDRPFLNATHTIEYSAYQESQEKLRIAVEALELFTKTVDHRAAIASYPMQYVTKAQQALSKIAKMK